MCHSAMLKRRSEYFGLPLECVEDEIAYAEFRTRAKKEPKIYKEVAEGGRITPPYKVSGSFAPIIVKEDGKYLFKPMRFGIWPKNYSLETTMGLSLFNSRRDNLQNPRGLWKTMFGLKQGLIVLDSFFEWVNVSELLKAGQVSLKDVERVFHLQELKRKKEALAKGKPFKNTKAELTPTLERDITIYFKLSTNNPIFVPVLYDSHTLEDGYELMSFSMITDEPLPVVSAAGHDRSPIFLTPDAILEWLDTPIAPTQADEILSKTVKPDYIHALDLEKAA